MRPLKDCPGNAACLDFSQIAADCAGGGRFKQLFPCKNKKEQLHGESKQCATRLHKTLLEGILLGGGYYLC